MIRRIIHIDEEKCNGCGICANACHEGAIAIIDGKARLMRDDYCDGMGDCLPGCPAGAISFEMREAMAYNEQAVEENKARKASEATVSESEPEQSRLSNWPVQIKLAPLKAPCFADCSLIVAASCTAYACAGFHERFIRDNVTLIGCPKLDGVDYSQKLAEIFRNNSIRSITVVRMEVPCCNGLVMAVQKAIAQCGKAIGCSVVTLSTKGEKI